MKDYFFTLAERLNGLLQGDERFVCSFHGEDSDFVRFNHNRVRQAGSVAQRSLNVDLIEGRRHAAGQCELEGNLGHDSATLARLVGVLRVQRPHLPEDPHLHYATKVHNSERVHDNPLPDSAQAVEQIVAAAAGLDLVGLWASGTQYAGFANSLGQRNWHSSATFNLDWSCCRQGDKAVKSGYAGVHWDPARLREKMQAAREQLRILARPAKVITPGRYRVYLAPAALRDILDMMSWGGFGLKSQRTAQTPLIQMVREGKTLHPEVSLAEHHGRGLAPAFTAAGFVKPERVSLIEHGTYRDCLTGARSAKEYGVAVNAGSEHPGSLDMAPGLLSQQEILSRLDRGLYLNNLWYCNFSERNNCQITGMTRFACFWVEHGRIGAPLEVMRFDESVYSMLGKRLLGLTREREFISDSDTYEKRSNASYLLPGVLVEGMNFTL